MNKNIIELSKQANRVLADVHVLDEHLLLANKSATQAGHDRAIERYVQDAARFMAKWFPGLEVATEADATAAHMILMHLAIAKYQDLAEAMMNALDQ